MTGYDSIFTDRVFIGSNDINDTTNPIGLLNLNNLDSLNSKLWIKIPIKTNVKYPNSKSNFAVFFVVKKFSKDESDILNRVIEAGGDKSNIYFDNNGNIDVIENDIFTDTTKHSLSSVVNGVQYNYFKNPLTQSGFGTSKPSIFSSSSGEFQDLVRDDFILTKNKHWILYRDSNNIYYLLYNPIHRKSFKNFYNNQSDLNFGLNQNLSDLFNQYCEITSVEDADRKPRKYADKSCNCIQIEDRIDDASGGYVKNEVYRSKVRKNAVCIAPECSTNLTVDDSSFMFTGDNNGLYNKAVRALETGCPPIQNIICDARLEAGNKVEISNSKINILCGNQEQPIDNTTTPAITTKIPTTTPSETTKPPIIEPVPQNFSLIFGIIGGVLGLIVIIVLGIFIYKKYKK